MSLDRRSFLKYSAISASGMNLFSPASLFGAAGENETVQVVVWDERQSDQKQAYDNFMGNEIAAYLRELPGLTVTSVGLDEPSKGLEDELLDRTDVLLWWGHIRQDEISWETGKAIVDRVEQDSLSLVALHSAHWATPFMEAMNRISRQRAEHAFPGIPINEIPPPDRFTTPEYDTRVTPYTQLHKYPDGSEQVDLHLPYCCFPAYRNDGKPSYIKITDPEHPLAAGLPTEFEIPESEMYAEPFHVPDPDEVVMEERWPTGEWFRSAMVWEIGQGKVVYFRPGHETYPVFKEKRMLTILGNMVNWLGNT